MTKSKVRLLLTFILGLIILIGFLWVVNSYVVSSIFGPRFESSSSTKVGDSSTTSTPKTDQKPSVTGNNHTSSQPDSNKAESTTPNSDPLKNPDTASTTTVTDQPVPTNTPNNLDDPKSNSDLGQGRNINQKDAYKI